MYAYMCIYIFSYTHIHKYTRARALTISFHAPAGTSPGVCVERHVHALPGAGSRSIIRLITYSSSQQRSATQTDTSKSREWEGRLMEVE